MQRKSFDAKEGSKHTDLRALQARWPTIKNKILRERESLSCQIANDDPIRLPIDLLGPINRGLDEATHTRALAYLLNPEARPRHGFEKAIMEAIVRKMAPVAASRRFLDLLHQKNIRLEVRCEYSIKGTGRFDIHLELHTRNKRNAALVIIENKIDAPDGKGQLSKYKAEANRWQKKNGGSVLLIRLAREKPTPHENTDRNSSADWASLTYLELASALRGVWKEYHHAEGRAWLGLYIATLAKDIVGIDMDQLQYTTVEELNEYLGITLK